MTATMDYLPRREADLVTWSANFNLLITATPTDFGLTAAQATAFAALNTAFANAYETANRPTLRTTPAIEAKNTAKQNLISGIGGIRELAMIIQQHPGTTNEQRSELGLTVRDSEPTPIPVPTVAPGLDVVSVTGRVVKVRVHDAASPSSRAKPAGCHGASFYTYVGETASEDLDAWKYRGSTTKNTIDIEFPVTVEGGSKVWITAYWTNSKLQSGPPCEPVSTNIAGGLAAAA